MRAVRAACEHRLAELNHILGWAGLKTGEKFATPIFDGATLEEITTHTSSAGIPTFGHTQLFDGGTGVAFDQKNHFLFEMVPKGSDGPKRVPNGQNI